LKKEVAMEKINNTDLVRVLNFCFDIDKKEMHSCYDCAVRKTAGCLDQDCEKTLIQEVVRRLTPSVEPERPKGRWKYYHKRNIAVCTKCSFERKLDADFGKAITCPNCGADMRGESDGC
jgi:hypothetical protein